MKRMVLATLLGLLFLGNNISAMDGLRKRILDLGTQFGEAIEKVENVPVIDKLTNLLPFAMVAACFRECPGQTMVALSGLLFYVLYKNDSVRSVLNKYKTGRAKAHGGSTEFDETLFVFDGEDEDYVQDEMDIEDALLFNDADDCKKGKNDGPVNQFVTQPAINFL